MQSVLITGGAGLIGQNLVHALRAAHVDRSIVDPEAFLQTNVLGTFTLFKAALDAWRSSSMIDRARFLQVSTDEVYGPLALSGHAFSESSLYRPNSPYTASNAASDHLVRSFVPTYGRIAV